MNDKKPTPLSRLQLDSRFWAFATLTILLSLISFWIGTQTNKLPTQDSPEAGFARDMATHHAQAVTMSQIIYDNTQDPNIKLLALDIILTQQSQIGQMYGWLNVWKLPLASTTPAMTWMDMPTTEPMPGMATPSDINRLRELRGVEADGLYLQLMIPHHRGGVDMANTILAYSKQPEVIALARSIVNSQTNEINVMQTLLQEKGFDPVPEQENTMMNHETPNP